MHNIFRKAEYQHWINLGCEYMKFHNPKKALKWLKKTVKVNKF
jgi:hydroxypyruvate isomerase